MEMGAYNFIDLTYLENLSKGSDAFIKKMLSVLLDQISEAVANIEKHFKNKDWKSLKSTSHKLKVYYMFIGVKELPDIVNSIEEYAANETNLDLLPDMISKIKDVTGKAMNELDLEIKSLQ